MSVQSALAFIQYARREAEAKKEIVPETDDLDEIVLRAGKAGYQFTTEELRAAFKHDWAMRWFHHSADLSGTKEEP